MPLQDQGVAVSLNGDWQVQGRHGPNPFKTKKTVSPSFKGDAFTRDKKERESTRILAEKPAWIVESCLQSKRKPGTTYGKRVTIKECTGKHVPRTALVESQAAKPVAKAKVTRGYPNAKKGRYMLD